MKKVPKKLIDPKKLYLFTLLHIQCEYTTTMSFFRKYNVKNKYIEIRNLASNLSSTPISNI